MGFVTLVELAVGDLWPLAFMMTKISYSGYRFPPVIIQQAIWLYARFTLSFRDVEDLLAERGITVSYETVRRWVNHFGSAIATDLRKRRPKPHSTWHLDEVYIKIDGRLVYLWRAVNAEGEVLDVLVQSKRDKRAALKLMRKLLKKMNFVPDKLVCGPTGQPVVILESPTAMNVGGGVTTERKTRINQPDGGSARCRGSRVRGQPSDSCPSTQPPTTPSTFSAISPPLARTESSELRPCGRGERSPPRLEPSGVDGFAASAIPQRDNAP
jgi:DDE domain